MNHKLSSELQLQSDRVFELAKSYGLTHFPIKFLSVSPKELNGIAAYTGFPLRIPHWRYGMEFENIHKKYQYGLSKIYELVINTNPVIAYLLNTNALVDQKLVMIHVCGHADFFYNNRWFSPTNRNMLDQMANNASRVKRIMGKEGEATVEKFLDVCFSLENLIDPYSLYIKRNRESENDDKREVAKLPAKPYMDKFINTKEFVTKQKEEIEKQEKRDKELPNRDNKDILQFLINNAPLEDWQKDILEMVREESYYFAPQAMTKIMNEGWATYIHSKFMTTHLAEDSDIIDYCDSQSRVMAAGSGLNPYRLGLALFKDIEERWNKGKFGFEWETCTDFEKKRHWDKELNKGKEKLFNVRMTHNDLTFIDTFLTPEFCQKEKLFSYKTGYEGYLETSTKFDEVQTQLLQMLANGGSPVIKIIDGNFRNRGELLLEHVFDGRGLDKDKGSDTLENLFKLWTRPVHLDTVESSEETEKEFIRWSYDGKSHSDAIVC